MSGRLGHIGLLLAGQAAPVEDAFTLAVAADAPAGWWRFNDASGTTATSHGSVNLPGTYYAGITLGGSVLYPGGGTSAAFNGTNGYMGAGSASDLTYADNFTLEALIKTGAIGSYRSILSHGKGGPYIRVAASGKMEFLKSQVAVRATSTDTPLASTVYLVGVVVEAGVPTLYINGAANGTGTTAADYGSPVLPVLAGADGDTISKTEYFNGSMGGAMIYGTPLSAARMLAHAQAAGLA